MKKTYITPSTKVVSVKINKHIMAASGPSSSSANIGNGGNTSTSGVVSADSKDSFFDSVVSEE